MEEWIRRLRAGEPLNKEQWKTLIGNGDADPFLFQQAVEVRQAIYGRDIYIRGLIELTNYCKNDCLYCGIRRSNRQAERYRLRPGSSAGLLPDGVRFGFPHLRAARRRRPGRHGCVSLRFNPGN